MTATQVSKSQCIELQSNPGYYLLKDAAYAWDRAVAAFGKQVLITGAWRSYETQEKLFDGEKYPNQAPQYGRYLRGNRAGQNGFTNDVRWWPAKGSYWTRKEGCAAAAVPGTSNHGGGLAVDVKTRREADDPPYAEAVIFASWSDADRTRFLRVAAEHGWDDDEGRIVNELWHLTYYPARDKHRGVKPPIIQQEEPDMDTTQAKQLSETRAIAGELKALIAELHAGIAPAIPTSVTMDPEKITLRAAVRDIRIAVTRQMDDAVARGVAVALQGVTGVDKAALTAGVVAEVSKAVHAMTESVEDTQYVLTPKEN